MNTTRSKKNRFDRWFEEFKADQDAPKQAVLITRRGEPFMILERRYSPRYAKFYCDEYNKGCHGALRQQGFRAVPVPIDIKGVQHEYQAST